MDIMSRISFVTCHRIHSFSRPLPVLSRIFFILVELYVSCCLPYRIPAKPLFLKMIRPSFFLPQDLLFKCCTFNKHITAHTRQFSQDYPVLTTHAVHMRLRKFFPRMEWITDRIFIRERCRSRRRILLLSYLLEMNTINMIVEPNASTYATT